MDLNKLLYDHQIALMKAAFAKPAAGAGYGHQRSEERLRTARHALGVAQYPPVSMQTVDAGISPKTPKRIFS